ncbi:MAG TPA: YadA-like family protein, partial [Rhodanobacteraceae bacterium]|nr:YadA-like family protein [Rhodanobacteraceae bacterium]
AVNLAQLNAATSAGTSTSAYVKANGANNGSDDAVAIGTNAIAAGPTATASGDTSVAIGSGTQAGGLNAAAVGSGAMASGINATAAGAGASAGNNDASAFGAGATASGTNASAIGGGAVATGSGAAAFGAGAQATATNSVAIGAGSTASMANVVSVGSAGNYREIVNVANPTTAHSAVTLGYLQSNYSTSNATNSAFTNLANEIDALSKQMAGLSGSPTSTASNSGTVGGAVAGVQTVTPTVTPAAMPVQTNGTVAGVQTVTPSASPPAQTVTPAGAQQQQAVVQADAYTDRQVQEALQSANTYSQSENAQTLNAAKVYTDQALTGYVTTDTLNQYEQEVNARFSDEDKRIDRVSAMSTAMVQMAASAAGIDTTNRVGLGVGSSGGQSALSVGYQRLIGKKATFTIGGSVSGNQSSVGAGVGFGW